MGHLAILGAHLWQKRAVRCTTRYEIKVRGAASPAGTAADPTHAVVVCVYARFTSVRLDPTSTVPLVQKVVQRLPVVMVVSPPCALRANRLRLAIEFCLGF